MGVLPISSQVARVHFRPREDIALQKDGAGPWIARQEKGAGLAERVPSCPQGPQASLVPRLYGENTASCSGIWLSCFLGQASFWNCAFHFRSRVEEQGKSMEGVFSHFGLEKS